MTQLWWILIFVVPVIAAAQDGERPPIPRSPLTEIELQREKTRLREEFPDWSAETIDSLFAGDSPVYTYRESDIRGSFPELTREDIYESLCSNSIMGGATAVTFLSAVSDNLMVLKSARCVQSEEGLRCGSLESQERYYFESISNNFRLDGIDYREASEVLSVFKAVGIEGLDDWHREMYKYTDVQSIRQHVDGYELTVGELLCKGCRSVLVVNLVKPFFGTSRLELVRIEDGICI